MQNPVAPDGGKGEHMSETVDPELRKKIEAVADTIPKELDSVRYRDSSGREGFRNPVRPFTGRAFTEIAGIVHPDTTVAIGTGFGFGDLRWAMGWPYGKFYSVEMDPEAADIARKNFGKAGILAEPGSPYHFEIITQDGAEYLRSWDKGPIEVFIEDSSKKGYEERFRLAVPHLGEDGLALLDNGYSHAPEVRPVVDFIANNNFYCGIFPEPTSPHTTGLVVASKSREAYEQAWQVLEDLRAADFNAQ